MVDDILLTPEEQDERAKKWLKDNGMALVIGVSLGLAAVYGFNQYRAQQERSAEQASVLYSEIMQMFSQSELVDIGAPLAELKNTHSKSSYTAKATLLRARQLSVSDPSAALVQLQWVIDNASEAGLQHTARVRLAKLYLSLGDLVSAESVATEQPYDGFDSHYLEILGDIAARQGDTAAASDYYTRATTALSSGDGGYANILNLKIKQLPPVEINTAQVTSAEPVSATPSDAEVPDEESSDAE